MKTLILKVIINAIAIAITAWLLPGIHVINNDIGTYLLVGLVFGIVNALIKPLISCLTCAVIILTLGLFCWSLTG
jgi:putative membrane protein